ncbi:MAG TPA: MFS transporter [Candidatus Sulfotelmatobacter sp.]|nr:MFS transporter [Candidatus Sulfotelmatobacter sp.]
MDRSVFRNRPFLFILFTAFLAVLGFGVIIPVVPFIVQKYVASGNTGQVALYVGLLTSVYSVCQFFAAPVFGALSDRFGRRPILLFCLGGSAVGYILFGIGGSLAILFASRIIDGITGGDLGAAFAYVADVTEPQERGKYYGVIGATVGIGFIVGPTVGGLLSQISLSAPVFFAAGLCIISMIYGYFVLPESLKKENRTSDFSMHHLNPFIQIRYILKKPVMRSLMIVGFFYFFAFSQMAGGFVSVFFKDVLHWTPKDLGFFFLVLGIGDTFTQGFLTGRLLPKFGTMKLVFSGFLLTGFAFFMNIFLPVFPYLAFTVVYIIIYAIGSGLFEPSFGGLVSSVASPQEQGRVQGASQSIQSICRILGPITAAFLYQINASLPWVSCVIFSLLGTYFLYMHRKNISSHIQSLPNS